MMIFNSLEKAQFSEEPRVLTIGTFDGVHRGHERVIGSVVEKARQLGAESLVFSFSNHPSTILHASPQPRYPLLLCSLEQKIALIEKCGVDVLLIPPFTHALSQQSAEEFITFLHKKTHFSHLILGYDAVVGRGREGDKLKLSALAALLGFSLEYLEPVREENEPISSRRIRALVEEGNLKEAGALLGRPYSIWGKALGKKREKKAGEGGKEDGAEHEKEVRVSVVVTGLALPPLTSTSLYHVTVCLVEEAAGKQEEAIFAASACLMLEGGSSFLELSFPESARVLGKMVEVIFSYSAYSPS